MRDYFWLFGIAALLGILAPEILGLPLAERLGDLITAGGDFSAKNVITIPQGGS
jgi:hypothetical protein